MNTTGRQTDTHCLLRWLAQACLLMASIGLVIASSIWTNEILFYSGIPLLVAALAWLFPAPAGIIGILFSLYQILRYSLYAAPPPFTPVPGTIETPPDVTFVPQVIYYLLYGIFILGCAIHLYLGIRTLRRAPTLISNTDKSIRLVARVITFGALLTSMIIFFSIDEAAVAFHFIVWAIIALGIVWFWPGVGGTLIVLVGGWSLYDLFAQSLWPETQIIYSMLFSVFIIGGILYLFLVLRRRNPAPT